LSSHASLDVAALVRVMLKESDNFVAEELLKGVGTRSHVPGTTAGGIRVVWQWGAKLGISAGTAFDGSGLSWWDRETPRHEGGGRFGKATGEPEGQEGRAETVSRINQAPSPAPAVWNRRPFVRRASRSMNRWRPAESSSMNTLIVTPLLDRRRASRSVFWIVSGTGGHEEKTSSA